MSYTLSARLQLIEWKILNEFLTSSHNVPELSEASGLGDSVPLILSDSPANH